MTSTALLERSAKYISARLGLTQLMSNDRSGLLGIWTAVTHVVWVLVGAPVHGLAAKAPVGASDTALNTRDGIAQERYANNFERNIASSLNWQFCVAQLTGYV